MKIASLIARILLGLTFLLFGLNGILNFMPKQPLPESLAKNFTDVFLASHYVIFVGVVEVIAAVLFLVGRFIPLALVFIGPVIVNILIFHTTMMPAPAAFAPGLVVTLCWFIVFFRHRAAFEPIFQARA